MTLKIKSALLSTVAAASGLFAIGATANAATVTVKAGDTVSKIARTHQTTISAIEKANHLKNVNLIFVGQKLSVNHQAAVSASSTTTPANTATPSTTTQNQSATTTQNNQAQASTTTTASNTTGADGSAKAWIANKESGGSYSARNGQYIGKYQLSAGYLNGDYSAANQERVANNYVNSRYGSWSAAKAHWESTGWY